MGRDWHVAVGPVLLQKAFCITDHEISQPQARLSNKHVGGGTSSVDELTGGFSNELEAASMGDCGLFRLPAGNLSHGILGHSQ